MLKYNKFLIFKLNNNLTSFRIESSFSLGLLKFRFLKWNLSFNKYTNLKYLNFFNIYLNSYICRYSNLNSLLLFFFFNKKNLNFKLDFLFLNYNNVFLNFNVLKNISFYFFDYLLLFSFLNYILINILKLYFNLIKKLYLIFFFKKKSIILK